MKIKKIRLYTLNMMPGSCLKWIRTSSLGTYTLEFTKAHACYKQGDQLNVMPYEVTKIE